MVIEESVVIEEIDPNMTT